MVFMVRRRARAVREHGMRILGLTDSMTCALALSKGRSSSSALNRVCRQVTATSLAAGISMHWRWIPSEWNPADRASRQLSGIGAACAPPPGLSQAPVDGPPRPARRRGARRGQGPTKEEPAARYAGRERAEGEEGGDPAKALPGGELEADRDHADHPAREALSGRDDGARLLAALRPVPVVVSSDPSSAREDDERDGDAGQRGAAVDARALLRGSRRDRRQQAAGGDRLLPLRPRCAATAVPAEVPPGLEGMAEARAPREPGCQRRGLSRG